MSSGRRREGGRLLECVVAGEVLWGVGIDGSIVNASLKAIVSAVNRGLRA